MGEYYLWVNVDRKEYLCPYEFNCGNKRHESIGRENDLLMALRKLLSDKWKDCRIVWLGDECHSPENVATELFELLQKHTVEFGYPGDFSDTILESYWNVSCLFKKAEERVREEIGYYLDESGTVNEYRINPENP